MDSLLGATIQFSGFNTETNKITSKPGPSVTHISGEGKEPSVPSSSLAASLLLYATVVSFASPSSVLLGGLSEAMHPGFETQPVCRLQAWPSWTTTLSTLCPHL